MISFLNSECNFSSVIIVLILSINTSDDSFQLYSNREYNQLLTHKMSEIYEYMDFWHHTLFRFAVLPCLYEDTSFRRK